MSTFSIGNSAIFRGTAHAHVLKWQRFHNDRGSLPYFIEFAAFSSPSGFWTRSHARTASTSNRQYLPHFSTGNPVRPAVRVRLYTQLVGTRKSSASCSTVTRPRFVLLLQSFILSPLYDSFDFFFREHDQSPHPDGHDAPFVNPSADGMRWYPQVFRRLLKC